MIKKCSILSLIIILLLNSFSYQVNAATFEDSGYYDYEGYIGNYKIALSVYYDNNKLVGSYLYDKYRIKINIDGKIEGKNIILNEYDNSKNITATFNGTIKDDDSISGIWKEKNGKTKYHFKLHLTAILPGREYGHRYGLTGFVKDKDAENYVKRIQKYVKSDDSENIAKLIAYPITVMIQDKPVVIKNKNQFIKNYNKIFYKEFKNTMQKANTCYMFSNYQGVMFGGNLKNIWISGVMGEGKLEYYIIAINN